MAEDQQVNDALMRSLLESMFGNVRYKNPPAADHIFEELDLLVFDNYLLKKYVGVDCPICAEGWKIDDEAKKLPCKHLFHTDCIRKWLKETNTCPMCRHELPTLDVEYEEERRRKERKAKTGSSHSEYSDESDEEGQSRYKPKSAPPTFMYM